MGKPRAKRQRDDEETAAAFQDAIADDEVADPTPKAKRARTETNKSLFVRSLPPSATAESLTDFFSQHYPVKHATVVLDPKTKASRGYGFVSFADPEDALEAKEKLNNFLLDGRRLRLDIAQPRHRDSSKTDPTVASKIAEEKVKREEALAEARKAPKLIIRNLPWSIKAPQQLEALFRSYGKVKFADLPNNKGKLSGFGFVTLRGRKNAEKALEAINGKVVDGRTVVVDWAVDKQTWEQQNKGDEADGEEKKNKKKKKASKPAKEEDDEDDDDMEGMTQEDRDLANFFKKHADDLESEPEGSENEDEEEDNEADAEDDEVDNSDSDDGDDDSEGGADLDGDDFDMSDEEEKLADRSTDNSKTLFIRNLPYTATDETLKTHFTQFGAIRYARIVMDRATGRPAGTGFVCFFNEDGFKDCLKNAPRHRPAATLSKHSVLQDETADPSGKYTFEGRILQVAQAVNKEEAARLADEAVSRKDKDKRRLFLLSEGQISPSNPLYKKLSPTEIKMRDASASQRKKLIQSNPSLHLSLTRLALRSIPRNLTSKDLKALARQAIVEFAKDVKEGRRQPISKEENSRGGPEDKEAEQRRKEKGKGVVKQAKIVFESNQGTKVSEDVGGGKSRGYGFIEYSSHRWALMGLRYLNGHPVKNESDKTQRLIVEFAIENANVVQRRRQQEEKQRLNPKKLDGEAKTKKDKLYQPGGKPLARSDIHKSKSSWKAYKRSKEAAEAKERTSDDGAAPPMDKKAKKNADEKLALRTKIIARKRLMRKKKAASRAGK